MMEISIYSASPVLSLGLANAIGNLEGLVVGRTRSDLRQLEDELKEKELRGEPPGVVVLELTSAVTLDTIGSMLKAAPRSAIVLWVGTPEPEFLSQAFALGVKGVVSKFSSTETHAECIAQVAAGNVWIDSGMTVEILRVKRVALTPRERQLMGLLAQGLRNKEIAWSLGITEGTVKVYLSHLFRKVGASDRLELALLALRNVVTNSAGLPGRVPASGNGGTQPLAIPCYVASRSREATA